MKTSGTFGPCLLLVLSSSCANGGSADESPQLILSTDGPAVLDAPITVTASLVNVGDYSKPFYFSFTDDAFPAHHKEITTEQTTVKYTLSYPSDEYGSRIYVMTVRAYTKFAFIKEEIAYNTTNFVITKKLNGNMFIVQNNSVRNYTEMGAIVSTRSTSTAKVELLDPEGFLKNASVTYYWFVNETSYGSTEQGIFNYQFSQPGHSIVEVMVLAKVPNEGLGQQRSSADGRQSEASSDNGVEDQRQQSSAPPLVKNGLFRAQVDSRNPMGRVDAEGNPAIKHGEMLKLNVTCDGSGPWSYCWSIKGADYNVTSNETCSGNVDTLQGKCLFPITWYFRDSGASSIIIVINDGLTSLVKQIGIDVYNNPGKDPMSLILIPIISVIVAVVAIVAGILAFVTMKRNLTGLETADFDFSHRDEQLEYKTFWERLRDSMFNVLSSGNRDNESNISSVSSRSIQGPPIGIHYGSIS